jgi:hypothetical protein
MEKLSAGSFMMCPSMNLVMKFLADNITIFDVRGGAAATGSMAHLGSSDFPL